MTKSAWITQQRIGENYIFSNNIAKRWRKKCIKKHTIQSPLVQNVLRLLVVIPYTGVLLVIFEIYH